MLIAVWAFPYAPQMPSRIFDGRILSFFSPVDEGRQTHSLPGELTGSSLSLTDVCYVQPCYLPVTGCRL